jgi:tRNA pseudouridine55 synthase
MDGVVFIDKEAGVTSRYVDNQIAKRFGTKKVGHLGTLDPFATGLLILAVGKATKFLPYIDDSKKSYLASLKLGFLLPRATQKANSGRAKSL